MPGDKTVYILGAGFSCAAGGPSQADIMSKIADLPDTGRNRAHKEILFNFLTHTLNIPDAYIGTTALEDIYTPIDRCLADGVALRHMAPSDIVPIRSALDYLIAATIQYEFDVSTKDKEYVGQIAKFLVQKAARRGELAQSVSTADEAKKHDPFSIIVLNWDLLLDNALNSALLERDTASGCGFGDYDPFGVVDYCCYVSSFDRDERRIRTGLWSLGCRGYNVKTLKLHGSMNWLQCLNCQRLFTAFDEKLVLDRLGDPCRHCSAHGIDATLRGTLVMPTFLKDLSNFQLKLVWQNASVELMEARRLIFIGYSLPQADFEVRQLLTRMLHRDASVHVVLWRGSPAYSDEKARYDQFFAGHTVTHDDEGVRHFVDEHVAGRV